MVTYDRLYDASLPGSINAGSPTDGDPVVSWTDTGADGSWTVLQGTAAARPTWQDAVQNGLAVVEFDGVDDHLELAGITADNQPQPNFIAVVCRFTGDTGSSARFMVHTGSGSSSQRNWLWVENGQWEIFAGGSRVTGPAATNDPVVVTAVFDGANSLIRVDGVEATGSVASSPGQQGIVIGARDDATEPWPGWIGELGFLYTRPTAQEIADEEDRLTAKWMGGAEPETREVTAHAAPASASADRTGSGEREATAHAAPAEASAEREGTATREATAHTGPATADTDRTGTGARETAVHTRPTTSSADRTGSGQRETTAHTGTAWAAAEAEPLTASVREMTAHARPAHATADRTGTGTRQGTAWTGAVTATATRTAATTREATAWAAPAGTSASRTGTGTRTATAHSGAIQPTAARTGTGTRTATAWTGPVTASATAFDLSNLRDLTVTTGPLVAEWTTGPIRGGWTSRPVPPEWAAQPITVEAP